METNLTILALALILSQPTWTAEYQSPTTPEVRVVEQAITPPTSLPEPPRTELSPLLRKLCMLESRCNPYAVNRKDTDGLSKHGAFQYDYQSFYDVNKLCKVLPNLELREVPNVIYDMDTQAKLTECAIAKGQGGRWPPLKRIL